SSREGGQSRGRGIGGGTARRKLRRAQLRKTENGQVARGGPPAADLLLCRMLGRCDRPARCLRDAAFPLRGRQEPSAVRLSCRSDSCPGRGNDQMIVASRLFDYSLTRDFGWAFVGRAF